MTISHETLFKVLGPEVVVEAEAALDGDTEMDTEAGAEQSHEGIGFGPQKLPGAHRRRHECAPPWPAPRAGSVRSTRSPRPVNRVGT